MPGPASPAPLRILLSAQGAAALAAPVAALLGARPHVLLRAEDLLPGQDADIACVTRDVTGLSTKHQLQPATRHFYDLMTAAPSLRWVHIHSAGADRPVFGVLRARGVPVTTSSGANAQVVAQSAVGGLLALARGLPTLIAAQRARRWTPVFEECLPRELSGQTAVIVGWGPVGQSIAAALSALGLRCIAVRRAAGPAPAPAHALASYDELPAVLPQADWLVLACPLTERTRGLVDAAALRMLPAGARLVNVARGEVVVQADLVDALRQGRLAGAFLDVFEHEPLPADAPLWDLPTVIATPHCAGLSDGNPARVAQMFLDNLARWCAGEPLAQSIP